MKPRIQCVRQACDARRPDLDVGDVRVVLAQAAAAQRGEGRLGGRSPDEVEHQARRVTGQGADQRRGGPVAVFAQRDGGGAEAGRAVQRAGVAARRDDPARAERVRETGLDGLTVRVVAGKLGVQPPAFATITRRALLSYRDGATMVSGTYLTDPAVLRGQEAGLASLARQGFTVADVVRAYQLLYSFTIGFCIEEQAVAQAGDDRYSLSRRAERVGTTTHPLAAEAGPAMILASPTSAERTSWL